MKYTIHIPNWHPAPLNKLLRHWRPAGRLKYADMQMIAAYAHNAGVKRATGRRSLEIIITLGKGQRGADVDAYFKSTCDALVRLGHLKDDSRTWLELKPVVYLRGEMATMIILEDLP